SWQPDDLNGPCLAMQRARRVQSILATDVIVIFQHRYITAGQGPHTGLGPMLTRDRGREQSQFHHAADIFLALTEQHLLGRPLRDLWPPINYLDEASRAKPRDICDLVPSRHALHKSFLARYMGVLVAQHLIKLRSVQCGVGVSFLVYKAG